MRNDDKKIILVVDDQPENLHVLISFLTEHGFTIFVAQSGEEVLERIERIQPDLILLDVMMPGIDGFETCRRLKENDTVKDIPVIFMTALTETVKKVEGFEAGGVDYITKPVQHEETLARIRTHLSIRKLQQQLHRQNVCLEEQKERFRGLSEATFEGIVIQDDGRIVEVNQAIVNIFGYERAELIGQNALNLLTPESRDAVSQHIRSGESQPYQAEGLRKDNSSFPVEFQIKTMPYHGHEARVAAIRDITWRKTMEETNAHLQKEIVTLKSTVKDRYTFGDIIGKSPAMQQVYELILKAADSEANVVIYGESGTGKDLVARTIHQMSDRREKDFVAVNCGGIPETLFESEFFGHLKGAFTGALRDKRGYFDAVRQGTLFLDEIGELTLTMQAKLLRAIEGKGYIPVGGHTAKESDVRIVAATNRNLEEWVQQGLFREDLFYRIHVVTINVPPLRNRKEDIPLLVAHFLEQFRKGEEPISLPGDVFEELYRRDWPGNIRELQNVLQRYLTLDHLDPPGSQSTRTVEETKTPSPSEFTPSTNNLAETVEQFEKHCLVKALEQHRWHRGKVAEMLGIDRKTLYRKLKKYHFI